MQTTPSHAGTAPRVLSAKLVSREIMNPLAATGATRGRQRSPKLQGIISNHGRGGVVDAATREEGIAASKVLSAVIRGALDHDISTDGGRAERTSPIKLLTWDRKWVPFFLCCCGCIWLFFFFGNALLTCKMVKV